MKREGIKVITVQPLENMNVCTMPAKVFNSGISVLWLWLSSKHRFILWGNCDLDLWPSSKCSIPDSKWTFVPKVKGFTFTGLELCFVRSPWPLTFDHHNLISSSLSPSEDLYRVPWRHSWEITFTGMKQMGGQTIHHNTLLYTSGVGAGALHLVHLYDCRRCNHIFFHEKNGHFFLSFFPRCEINKSDFYYNHIVA